MKPEPAQKFFSREISDLAFIRRVLEEAENPEVPVLERVRYLAITEMLLDEFYSYRVAELRAAIRSGKTAKGPFGFTPKKELEAVDSYSNDLLHSQVKCWQGIKKALAEKDISIISPGQLKPHEKVWLKDTFSTTIISKAKPIYLKEGAPFPSLPSGEVLMALEFTDLQERAFLPLPFNIPRFINLGENDGRFLLLEDALDMLLPKIFPGRKISGKGLFRVIREGDLKISGEKDDLPGMVKEALENREKSDFIRLKVTHTMPEGLRAYLAGKLKILEENEETGKAFDTSEVASSEFVAVDGLLGLADGIQLVEDLGKVNRPDLFFPKFIPSSPTLWQQKNRDIFSTIRRRDILLHTPFDSFETILHLLIAAAGDKAVKSIRATIYRVEKDSLFVEALAKAAKAGKKVTAIIELEARDDERNNLLTAERLREAGAQVLFGFLDMKVHAKAIEIIREEAGKDRSYVVLGTGNFHTGAAKSYTDLFLITTAPDLSRETGMLIDYIANKEIPKELHEFAVAPLNLRKKLISLIQNETRLAREGKPAEILIKMNKLGDRALIEELYRASSAGVKITLLVRGICCLRPGVKGLSENIEVRSIVGRFLEHSRIFCFSNGHPLSPKKANVYISSADCMTHKIDGRVEVLIPIKSLHIRQQILTGILQPYLNDQAQSWQLQNNGSYERANTGHGINIYETLLAVEKRI